MLSRFSALLVYIVAGLVISAAATPTGQSADYNDEPKYRPAPYHPHSYSPHHKYQEKPYSKPYDHTYKPYALGEDKPYYKPYPEEKKYPEANKYPEEKKYPEKKYPRDKKYLEEKPHPEDKKYLEEKPHPEDKKHPDSSSDDKGKIRKSDEKGHKSEYSDKDGKSGQCAVEDQHCCDSIDSIKQVRRAGIPNILTLIGLTGNAHTNCSPYINYGGAKSCTAQTVCCSNAEFYGAIAIGCTNINL
ncbi:hypothetical protein H4582DRAFT_2127530 [Lactarius indigo]|nr:hypothetical protein H4582DRAFT_2127530 [Lactarius indigo]